MKKQLKKKGKLLEGEHWKQVQTQQSAVFDEQLQSEKNTQFFYKSILDSQRKEKYSIHATENRDEERLSLDRDRIKSKREKMDLWELETNQSPGVYHELTPLKSEIKPVIIQKLGQSEAKPQHIIPTNYTEQQDNGSVNTGGMSDRSQPTVKSVAMTDFLPNPVSGMKFRAFQTNQKLENTGLILPSLQVQNPYQNSLSALKQNLEFNSYKQQMYARFKKVEIGHG